VTETERARESIAVFLRLVGLGKVEEVRRALAAAPALVDAAGPHPFWGGRPRPLHVAVEARRGEIFHLLLDAGADLDAADADYGHWSPSMLALQRGFEEMAGELRRRGARVGLAEALLAGDDTAVEALLAARETLTDFPGGGSYVSFARTPRALDLLLARGASIDRPDAFGVAPIQTLAGLGKRGAPLVARLVERGARPTPEIYARLGDGAALAEWYAREPGAVIADVILFTAVAGGHHDLVRWLLDRGASVGARTGPPSRHTALHAAAWNGDLAMAKLLVDAGADCASRDEEHDATPEGWADTAVHVRNDSACAAVAEFLRSRDPSAAATEPPPDE
jgi:ankyrin repeat protein